MEKEVRILTPAPFTNMMCTIFSCKGRIKLMTKKYEGTVRRKGQPTITAIVEARDTYHAQQVLKSQHQGAEIAFVREVK
jgi:tRNA(Phe) wybutosine-synthesizing methylase Tyw3